MVIITILLTTINIISDFIHIYFVDIIWTLPQSHIESYSILIFSNTTNISCSREIMKKFFTWEITACCIETHFFKDLFERNAGS